MSPTLNLIDVNFCLQKSLELFDKNSADKLKQDYQHLIQRVPALRTFWDLEKTVLHEICVSGTVVNPLLT